MRNKIHTIFLFLIVCSLASQAQTNTNSPYSRYGLGELNQPTFAHNAGMGGAHIAWRPDSTILKNGACHFINTGNPASYSFIRLTSLEVGGNFIYSDFKASSSSLKKWGTNFSYGTLGFPVKGNGGAVLGIMPFSNVGYDVKSVSNESSIGDVTYLYTGSGSLNKVFAGYGVMPFSKRLVKFRKKHLYIPDSMKTLTRSSYRLKESVNKVLSDFSIGFNANYIFGNVEQTARVVYPNSILYNNTYRNRTFSMGDFTGNFGVQTAFTIDSAKGKDGGARRALKEKVKLTLGFYMNLNNPLQVNYDAAVYNYILSSSGQEIVRDTVLSHLNQKGTITLPLEQGFGIGFKKGERLNLVADFAITNWQNFKYIDQVSSFKNNYRVALGMNYVPEKEAAGAGAYLRKINYRLGVNYNTGYIDLKNTLISSYAVTAGVGLPVGIGQASSMVNVAVQYGQMGSLSNNLVKENYWRINFGFTFSDRWFQKFRYD
ncbi:MAG: hypothetical protein K0S12_1117 [Bacteroidetes bacterium]|nr:hypothetical protein [Bacteroidota bacterium]